MCISIHSPTRGATKYAVIHEIIPKISIHSPTRGATHATVICAGSKFISIHSPTRGATCSRQVPSCKPLYFNPLSHERSDNVTLDTVLKFCISIHSPTRGATTAIREGSNATGFQSTLPREERLDSHVADTMSP